MSPIQQMFLGVSSAADSGYKFNEYGSLGDEADTIASISEICYKDGNGGTVSNLPNGSACMKNKATASNSFTVGDYSNVMIYGGNQSGYTEMFYPTGAAAHWGQVSNANHIGVNIANHTPTGQTGNMPINFNYGNIWQCGTGGVHAAAKGYVKVMTQSGGGTNTPYVQIRNEDSPYDLKTYHQTFGVTSFRFNQAIDTLDLTVAQVTKDQAGAWSQTSGQPTMFTGYVTKNHNGNGGLVNSFPSQGNYDFSFAQNTNQNTHGHSGRGTFLGGRLNGTDREMYYIFFYYNWSNGDDGARYCKMTVDSSGAVTVNWKGPHFYYSPISSDGGYCMTCKPGIWPHGIATRNDANSSPNNNNGTSSTNKLIYYNLSTMTNTSTGIEDMGAPPGGNANIDTMAVIGTWSSGTKPIIAYFDKYNWRVCIRRYDPGVGWGSLMCQTANIGGNTIINGIYPIENTNRILLAKAPGVSVLEISS